MFSKLGKYLAWIGPYPYNPWLIFVFFATTYFTRFLPGLTQQPAGGPRWLAGLIVLSLACIPSGLFAVLALVFQKFRFWPTNLFTYVLEVAVGQSLLLLFSPVMAALLRDQLGLDYSAPITLTPSLFLASLLLVLAILGVMHHGERSIRNRLAAADKLVAKLELDRDSLVKADIELREQTSKFLHDRVQSDLMVAAMKLKAVAGKSDQQTNEVIDLVISRLEQTRTTDLRELVQVLAPNFEANGLRESVRVLAKPYLATMDIEISIDEESESLSHDAQLGVFKIIEQSLLNSLVHGPAKHVMVSLKTDPQGRTQLEISDDGPGAVATESPGVGTAVIDSWLSILAGSKRIETVEGYGYRLSVSFLS